jgi:KDO2-lipid IV(A) lauroyltransferase
VTLTSAARASWREPWRMVDRTETFTPFVTELEKRAAAANPDFQIVEGRPIYNRAGGVGAKIVLGLFRMVRWMGPDRVANLFAWFARKIGPLTRGHRRAIEQLELAFPEKTPEERQRIAVGMWDNLARTGVEYGHLETIWRHDPTHPERSRVIRTPESTRIWEDIKAANRPTLHFSLHIANWELAAIAGVGYVRCLIPYRRMKNRAFTEELVRIRVAAGITPITASASMVSEIRREFGPGDGLGMLIDQRYVRGIEVQFFGRPTLLNPLFARLARIYDCPIYGSRVIRRKDHRFDYEIVPVEPARDARGRVDVAATMQVFTSIMERWIREHPEQWMWLHRLWR